MKQRLPNAIFLGCLGAALISMTMGVFDREVRALCFVAAAAILIEGWATWYITTHDEHGQVVYPVKCLRFLTAEMKWRLVNASLLACLIVSLWLPTLAVAFREIWTFCCVAAAAILIEGWAFWYVSTHDEDGRSLKPAKCLLDEF
jgi:hypothetical protein